MIKGDSISWIEHFVNIAEYHSSSSIIFFLALGLSLDWKAIDFAIQPQKYCIILVNINHDFKIMSFSKASMEFVILF